MNSKDMECRKSIKFELLFFEENICACIHTHTLLYIYLLSVKRDKNNQIQTIIFYFL